MIGFLLGHLGLITGLLGAGGGVLSMFFPVQALAILKALGALPKPVFIAACGVLAFLFIRAEGESRHWHKQSDRYERLYTADHTELDRLRKQSKAQQDQVAKTVDHYVTVERPVIRKQVERIETAPLPGNCKTPTEVLGAAL